MKSEINNTTTLQDTAMNPELNQSKNNSIMATATLAHKPSFGTVDFWNVQKMRRDRVYRRYM